MAERSTVVSRRLGALTFRVHEERPGSEHRAWREESILPLLRLRQSKLLHCSRPADRVHPDMLGPSLIDILRFGASEGRPVVISPGAVWLTLLQGQRLTVGRTEDLPAPIGVSRFDALIPGSSESDWASVIRACAGQSVEGRRPSLTRLSPSLDASGSLMAAGIPALGSLFGARSPEPRPVEGLPLVTVEGTVADWTRLAAFARRAAPGFETWLKGAGAVCEVLALASQGRIDRALWRGCVADGGEPQGDSAGGWLARLYPVRVDPQSAHVLGPNPLLFGPDPVPLAELPRGLMRLPLRWRRGREFERATAFGGILGVRRDRRSGALHPLLGWAIQLDDHPRQP